MLTVETIGIARCFVTLNVPLSEMKDWEASRITDFFEGIARILAATNPNNWDALVSEPTDKEMKD